MTEFERFLRRKSEQLVEGQIGDYIGAVPVDHRQVTPNASLRRVFEMMDRLHLAQQPGDAVLLVSPLRLPEDKRAGSTGLYAISGIVTLRDFVAKAIPLGLAEGTPISEIATMKSVIVLKPEHLTAYVVNHMVVAEVRHVVIGEEIIDANMRATGFYRPLMLVPMRSTVAFLRDVLFQEADGDGCRKRLISELALQDVDHLIVTPQTMLGDAVEKLNSSTGDPFGQKRRCVLVCSGQRRLKAILTEWDVVSAVYRRGASLGSPIESLATKKPVTVRLDDTVERALYQLLPGGYHQLPITDGRGGLKGLLDLRKLVCEASEHFWKQILCINPDPNWRWDGRVEE